MKKIFFMPLFFVTSIFSMSDTDEMDLDNEMDWETQVIPEKPVLPWSDKANKLRSLYGSLRHAEDNKNTIETIKKFHNDYLIKYDDYRFC